MSKINLDPVIIEPDKRMIKIVEDIIKMNQEILEQNRMILNTYYITKIMVPKGTLTEEERKEWREKWL
jgi:hypothetical protein